MPGGGPSVALLTPRKPLTLLVVLGHLANLDPQALNLGLFLLQHSLLLLVLALEAFILPRRQRWRLPCDREKELALGLGIEKALLQEAESALLLLLAGQNGARARISVL